MKILQNPNDLAMKCDRYGIRILGTSPRNIDRAENRHIFSALLDGLDIDQPEWKELTNIKEAKAFAKSVGFPVLIRPSYVLSGAAMSIGSIFLQFFSLRMKIRSIIDDSRSSPHTE